MKKYIILKEFNSDLLALAVNAKLKEGYTLVGGVSVSLENYAAVTHCYVQAMIKEDIEVK